MACTPGAGWEKGQVERQVGDLRARLFARSPRGCSYAEIDAWLMDRCIEEAKKHPHPTIPGKTVWEVFEVARPRAREHEVRPSLMAYRGPFDGFHATEASVSKTCLVRFDNNRYSVEARAVGPPVDVRAYADRIVIRQDGEIVAEHPRLPFWRAHERATVAARSPTIRGTTCRSCSASPVRFGTAPPSGTGRCPGPSRVCGPGWRATTTGTGSSSRC